MSTPLTTRRRPLSTKSIREVLHGPKRFVGGPAGGNARRPFSNTRDALRIAATAGLRRAALAKLRRLLDEAIGGSHKAGSAAA